MQYLGALVVVFGTISWATGSVFGSRFPHPAAPRMAAALQMMMGGLLLLLLGSVFGEWSRLDPAGVSMKSVASLAYLVVFGSIIAFAIITETVFQWPGVGLLFINAIQFVDIPVMAAYLMLISVLFVGINLIVDLLYFAIDPRLRVDRTAAGGH